MSETILNGYLINKNDYQTFDEVITFVTPDNERISCLSLGSRKIESKNGRNLFLGNFNEFQIFRSRGNDKLSKLKKAITLKPVSFNMQSNMCFILLNECVNLAPPNTRMLFYFYQMCLNTLNEDKYSLSEIFLIILMRYIKLLGIGLVVDRCIICGSKKIKTISFSKHGMLCPNCISAADMIYDLKISKLTHFLFIEQFNELNKYQEYHLFVIDILKTFIQENSGIFLKTNI